MRLNVSAQKNTAPKAVTRRLGLWEGPAFSISQLHHSCLPVALIGDIRRYILSPTKGVTLHANVFSSQLHSEWPVVLLRLNLAGTSPKLGLKFKP